MRFTYSSGQRETTTLHHLCIPAPCFWFLSFMLCPRHGPHMLCQQTMLPRVPDGDEWNMNNHPSRYSFTAPPPAPPLGVPEDDTYSVPPPPPVPKPGYTEYEGSFDPHSTNSTRSQPFMHSYQAWHGDREFVAHRGPFAEGNADPFSSMPATGNTDHRYAARPPGLVWFPETSTRGYSDGRPAFRPDNWDSAYSAGETTPGLYRPEMRNSDTPSFEGGTSIIPAAPFTMKRSKAKINTMLRKQICLYSASHPNLRQTDIAVAFNIERSTVSKILKQKRRWLDTTSGSIEKNTSDQTGSQVASKNDTGPSHDSHQPAASVDTPSVLGQVPDISDKQPSVLGRPPGSLTPRITGKQPSVLGRPPSPGKDVSVAENSSTLRSAEGITEASAPSPTSSGRS